MSGNFVGVHFLTWALKPGRLQPITGLVCYKQYVEMDYVWRKKTVSAMNLQPCRKVAVPVLFQVSFLHS